MSYASWSGLDSGQGIEVDGRTWAWLPRPALDSQLAVTIVRVMKLPSHGWLGGMNKRKGYNPKRRIASAEQWPEQRCRAMAARVGYGGNSEHKSRPSDYRLTPPANPRPGKTLCDAVGEFSRARAEELLRAGLVREMVSVQERDGWPQNIWSVSEGEAYESQLENKDQGIYHGYSMPTDDDFRNLVLTEWKRRES